MTLFLTMSTQWDRAGLDGVRTGLKYGRLPAVAGMLDIVMTSARLHDLRVMEAEALATRR